MINSFQTEFDTRSRKNQQEVLLDGESCDLVACLERDGVPLDLAGCTVTGLYQPESMKGKSDSWYEVPTEIQQNRVIVHWDTTYQMQGERKYYIYALVVNVQGEDVAYPCSWILELANSPSFPVDPVQPIPKMLDFSQYTLVNDKWLRVEHVNPTTDQVAQNVHFTGDVVIENLDILDPELKEQIDDIQEKVTDIQTTVDGIDGKVALEATSQDIKGRLTNATTGLAAIKAGIDATNLALPSLATGQSVAAVSTALSDQTNGLAAIKGAVNTANTSLQSYVGPNSQLHSWIQGLYGAVVSDDTLATIYNMVSSMTEPVADIANTVEDLPEHVSQLLENTQDVPEKLAVIDGMLDSEEYGLEAIKNAVDSIVPPSGYATSAQAQGIIDRLDNQTNGLAAIRNQAATAATKSTATATALSSNVYGLNAIKTAVDQGVSQATTAAAMSSAAVTIVNDSGYGNQAIKNAVGTVDARLTDANNGLAAIKLAAASANSNAGAANITLGNSTYGLEAIKGAVNTANSALASQTYGLQAIKEAVDEISHPTDYARQSTLTTVGAAASTAAVKSNNNYDLLTGNNGLAVIKAGNDLISDKIGSTPYGNLADHLAAVNNSLQDSLDTKATSAQAAQILTLAQETRTLAEVNNMELNAVYGLAGIYGEVQGLQDGTHPLVQAVDAVGTDAATTATKTTANNGLLTDSTNGLAAIKTAVNAANTALSDQTNGLAAIKTQATDAATQAASAATKAQTVATTVNNGTYGNQAIRTAVDAANAALGNSTYGLAKIKQAVDNITFPSDYATSAQATSIINKLDDSTNGLAAIKTSAAAAATDAAAVKTAVQDSTNGLNAIKTAVNTTNNKLDNSTYGLQAIYNGVGANNAELTNQYHGLSAISNSVSNVGGSVSSLQNTANTIEGCVYDSTSKESVIYVAETTRDMLQDSTNGLAAIKLAAASANSNAAGANITLGNSTYGLSAIKTAVNTVNSTLGNGTNGLAAIKTAVDTVDARLTDSTNGLAAIKTQASTAASQATTAATKATANNTLLTDSTYGLAAIQTILGTGQDGGGNYADMTEFLDGIHGEVGDIYTRVETTKNVVTNATYGNQAIKNDLTDSTNGLAAIKTQASTAATQSTTAATQAANAAGAATNIYNYVTSSSTGLPKVTNSLDSIAYQVSSVDTTVGQVAGMASNINDVVTSSTYGNQAIKNTLTDSTNGLAAIKTQAAAATTQAQNAYNIVNNATYGNSAIQTAIGATNARLDDQTIGLQAIKNAVSAITIPTDYAKEATLEARSASILSYLGNMLEVLQIINGEFAQ